ncbi:glycosyl hydrolase family protein [Lacihabitans sp. CCS-44]|uniref:glycoside hydrolase family 1 protein n=1 Tax=Lacihabitans sp. CCS-44 TaxID=2487331 RepID=UPI0020CF940F|nr:family 1 glycosylhydrolase [Lacihabitans sp. CCS-44]MCP9757164.1 glycosyl hydrolase family protein [Lacihabitans sp. CCS-44]
MNKIVKSFFLLFLIANISNAQKKEPFLWGVATCAYQVEGAYQTDGKGESKWDFLTNTVHITEKVIGQNHTGNVSINMYDRTQYLKDIALMKELGLNSYRMSLDWSRIIPDGTGAVNEVALKHYDVLIDDLLAAGIEPFVTLYHFDYPALLLKKGGWANPEMPNWYYNYASVVLKRYGGKVKHFITFNEPYIEFFLVENLLSGGNPNDLTKEKYMSQMQKAHAQMVTNARVIKLHHDLKLNGEIGIVLNVNPAAPWDEKSEADKKVAEFQDILINGLFLDPLYKGHYPKMALDSMAKYNPTFKPSAEEMTLIASNKPDFLGINFYAPAIVKGEDTAVSLKWLDNNPDEIKSNVGPVRPEYLYKMLMRLKTDYNNPKVYITENGTGYVSEDVKVNGKINDPMRADYIKRHIEWSLKAKSEGANLNGYMVWSGWDNFEWVSGYTKRLGLIYVDFETQERTPKQSFYEYQKIIKANKGL